MVLTSILLATLAGGAMSVLAAALFAYALLEKWIPRMVSFAVGALLSAAWLDLLPEALEAGADAHDIFATVLAGLLAFFLLEKFALWRHGHHGHDHHRGEKTGAPGAKPSGMMIVVGDALHNFVDGIVIAAAFLADPAVGWATAIGVIAHEVPQEVGDFMVLLDAGHPKRRALFLNLASSLASIAGGLLGYFALEAVQGAIPYVLAFSAAGLVYVAVADLVPDLHRRFAARDTLSQLVLISLGIAAVLLAGPQH